MFNFRNVCISWFGYNMKINEIVHEQEHTRTLDCHQKVSNGLIGTFFKDKIMVVWNKFNSDLSRASKVLPAHTVTSAWPAGVRMYVRACDAQQQCAGCYITTAHAHCAPRLRRPVSVDTAPRRAVSWSNSFHWKWYRPPLNQFHLQIMSFIRHLTLFITFCRHGPTCPLM